jgi:hypothetical protein
MLKSADKIKKRGDLTFAPDPTHKKMIEEELKDLRRRYGIVAREKNGA